MFGRNQNTNFVRLCWSHTFPHCWDGMSNDSTFVSPHCRTNNVCQFDPSLYRSLLVNVITHTHLLGWNVWQKPKYKFCVIMFITHVSTLLRWDVKLFNFCQPTLLDQQCSSNWPQPYSIWSTWWSHRLATDVPSIIACVINCQSIFVSNLDSSNFLLESGFLYFDFYLSVSCWSILYVLQDVSALIYLMLW